ncbi:MAG: T9SS type A sorting domain-containing protein, partial [Bacteroidota bacterium]
WESVSGDVFGGDLDFIEISNINNDLIYVSKAKKIFKSEDGGINFTELNTGFSEGITSIEINNNNNDIVYITLGGFYNNNVYKSVDGGENWMSINRNLPGEPKFIIKHQNQSLENDLYVGTALGVYHINDNMTEWEVFSKNLPNVPVKDLEINTSEKTITAGTYGRGVWQSPIEVRKAEYDIMLEAILSNNSIQCNSAQPTILVRNNGLNTITAIDINYSIDGESFHHQFTGNISTDNGEEITLPINNSLTPGEHELIVNATITNDAFIENNSLKAKFTVNNSGRGQYINTFGDINPDEWLVKTIGSSNDLWQKGKATQGTFKDISENAYITNLIGNYFDETTSYLISPCYDLTTLENPVLKFDMAFDIELDWDVLYMEYSVDKGVTWNILGTASDPNWYNSSFKDIKRPITVGKQWTGKDMTLKEYSYDLAPLKNENNIIFRFVFASDQAVNEEGVLIDNFTIDATAILAVKKFDKDTFMVYPNPSNGTVFINRQGVEEMQISIYDVTGKLILRKNNISERNFQLNLSHLEKGLYFLKINETDKQTSKKLILK